MSQRTAPALEFSKIFLAATFLLTGFSPVNAQTKDDAAEATAESRGGKLGVTVEESTLGVRVKTIQADSAATKAGMKIGDIIVQVNNSRVGDKQTLLDSLDAATTAVPVQVVIRRSNANSTLQVSLTPAKAKTPQKDAEDPESADKDKADSTAEELTDAEKLEQMLEEMGELQVQLDILKGKMLELKRDQTAAKQ